jgi:hypothetical protein
MKKLSWRKYALQLMNVAMDALRENSRKRAVVKACYD